MPQQFLLLPELKRDANATTINLQDPGELMIQSLQALPNSENTLCRRQTQQLGLPTTHVASVLRIIITHGLLIHILFKKNEHILFLGCSVQSLSSLLGIIHTNQKKNLNQKPSQINVQKSHFFLKFKMKRNLTSFCLGWI